MGRNSKRRQVGGTTTDGNRIAIGGVSSNGCAVRNARAKGCFGSTRAGSKPLKQRR